MPGRWKFAAALAVVTLLWAPVSASAGDAFLKVGLTLTDVGGFTDRWYVSLGTDWGFNDSGYLGLEFQGAYRSNTAVGGALVDSVPGNVFVNGKWKGWRGGVRPFAGLGFGMMSSYVRTEFAGRTESRFVKDGGVQLMGGIELHDKWIFELQGQRIFLDGASFNWALLVGRTW
jgi:hypothetical protein